MDKQNLQIKTLWGHSENAVKTHLWIAICTYFVVAYLKSQLSTHCSIYEMIQILGFPVFAKTPINELFAKQIINQNVKGQLNLFNYNQIFTNQ